MERDAAPAGEGKPQPPPLFLFSRLSTSTPTTLAFFLLTILRDSFLARLAPLSDPSSIPTPDLSLVCVLLITSLCDYFTRSLLRSIPLPTARES